MIQCFLYNQHDVSLINPDASHYYHLISTTPPHSPIGPLNFSPISRVYEYCCAQEFVSQHKKLGRRADCIIRASYAQCLRYIITQHPGEAIQLREPIEPYLARHFRRIMSKLMREHTITITMMSYNPFLINHDEFCQQFGLDHTNKLKKPPIMETFYRWMRKKTGRLMQDNNPVGGQRNYDKENRKWKKGLPSLIRPSRDHPRSHQAHQAIGVSADISHLPINHAQAHELLTRFGEHGLLGFGTWEDAMYIHNPLVHHSTLSTPLNIGLLSPRDIIENILSKDHIPINDREGFLRQILGRREYMRQRFLYYHDDIYTHNHLMHTHHAPGYRRHSTQGKSGMNCLDTVTLQVEHTGYAHHIQRLMIVGNIGMLLAIHPHDILKRFWEQFVDAYERVVTPNVLGMSQYVDGGNLATKPYIAGANYIKTMSDYCTHCHFDPNKKEGSDACPVTTLYRGFIHNHKDIFRKGRQPFLLKNLERLDINTLVQLTHILQQRYTHDHAYGSTTKQALS